MAGKIQVGNNLTRKTFGKLKVIKRAANRHSYVMWECVCTCGTVRNVATSRLLNKKVYACQKCMKEERNKKIMARIPQHIQEKYINNEISVTHLIKFYGVCTPIVYRYLGKNNFKGKKRDVRTE